MKAFISILTLISVIGLSGTASASGGGDIFNLSSFSLVDVTTTSAGIGGGIMTTMFARKTSDQNKTLRSFLQNNRTELQAAFQIGSGEVIDDFAAILKISPKFESRFSIMVRKNRKIFIEIARLKSISVEQANILILWSNQNFNI